MAVEQALKSDERTTSVSSVSRIVSDGQSVCHPPSRVLPRVHSRRQRCSGRRGGARPSGPSDSPPTCCARPQSTPAALPQIKAHRTSTTGTSLYYWGRCSLGQGRCASKTCCHQRQWACRRPVGVWVQRSSSNGRPFDPTRQIWAGDPGAAPGQTAPPCLATTRAHRACWPCLSRWVGWVGGLHVRTCVRVPLTQENQGGTVGDMTHFCESQRQGQ